MSDSKTGQEQDPRHLFTTAADDVLTARTTPPSSPPLASPAYRLAFDDHDFLLREEMRPVRLLLELSKPELALIEHDIRSTVVMFGSARTVDPAVSREREQALLLDLERRPDDAALAADLARCRRELRQGRYYDEARRLAAMITTQSLKGNTPKLHIITGGGPGIMEAANRGASDAGGKSVGLSIVLPQEQLPNPYITPELCFRFHYFAMRKMHFLMRAIALVVFPGGYGTMDELFETLTLVQTGKVRRMPIILFGRDHWHRIVNWDLLLEEGMIGRGDLELLSFVENAEAAWEAIRESLGP
jgi:uncharacterized protein (TIGR00730 family)